MEDDEERARFLSADDNDVQTLLAKTTMKTSTLCAPFSVCLQSFLFTSTMTNGSINYHTRPTSQQNFTAQACSSSS